MERYSRVYHFDEPLYYEKCPVIIMAGAILKDNDTSDVIAQLKFESIVNKIISTLDVELELFDPAGELQEKKVNHQYLDLNVNRYKQFGSKEAIKLPYNNTRSFSVRVTKVIFNDGTKWVSSEDEKITKLDFQKELSSILNVDELNYFNLKYGSTARLIPCEQGNLWFCTCGGINTNLEKECAYCRLSKKEVLNIDYELLKKEALYNLSLTLFDSYTLSDIKKAKKNFEYLDNFKDSKDNVEKCKNKMKELEKQQAKTFLQIKVAIIVLVAFFVLIGAFFLIKDVIIPNSIYNEAINLMEDQKYTKAIEKFDKLPLDYKDSKKLKQESLIKYAEKLTKEKKFEKAISIYQDLDLYSLNADLYNTIYLYGEDLYAREEYENAYKQFLLCKFDKAECNKKSMETAEVISRIKLKDKNYGEAMKWAELSVNLTLINEVKYDYVINNKNVKDTMTYSYLVDLVKDNYKDSLNLYNQLYYVKCSVIINSSREDYTSSPTKILQYNTKTKDFVDLYAHYKIDTNIPTGSARLKTSYETRWGYDNVAKRDWEIEDKYSYKSSATKTGEWHTAYLKSASNLYYHRYTIYNADTGKLLCTSKSVYTPYNY